MPPAIAGTRRHGMKLAYNEALVQLYGRQTVKNIHFALAVIAYGDAEGISETLESIALQDLDAGISLSVAVARHHDSITEAGIRDDACGDCTAECHDCRYRCA